MLIRHVIALHGVGLAMLLAACATEPSHNNLLGNWVVDLPTTPRAHGNLVGFRKDCVFVRGNRVDTRIASPVHYQSQNADFIVWYGQPARSEPRNPAQAARVTFMTPDRIRIAWPEGFDERYMRGIASSVSNSDCR